MSSGSTKEGRVYRVNAPLPGVNGGSVVASPVGAPIPAVPGGNAAGLAFSSNGNLIYSTTTGTPQLVELNPNTGAVVSQTTTNLVLAQINDMASCASVSPIDPVTEVPAPMIDPVVGSAVAAGSIATLGGMYLIRRRREAPAA